MRTLSLVLPLVMLALGCSTSPEIRRPEAARSRAKYYRTEAAGLKKQISQQDRVIKLLSAELEDEEKYLDTYDKKADMAGMRVKELEKRNVGEPSQRRAIERLLDTWQRQEEAMEVKSDEQMHNIAFLHDQLRMQREFREELENEVERLLDRARKMEKLAQKLEEKDTTYPEAIR